MKISSFYLMDIDSYDDIITKITDDIEKKFYGVGKNSISISHFISYLRNILHDYLKFKYKKDYKIILTIPKIDEKIVIKEDVADNVIKIRLLKDKIDAILSGDYYDFENYINEIIDQLETELTSRKKFDFKEYLVIQLDGLVMVAQSELAPQFNKEFLLKALLNKEQWNTLSKSSAIFNEYYTAFMMSDNNKVLFANFLKKLYVAIKNGE